MNFPRNEFETWALPHFSGGDAEAVIALMELDSKGDYRSDEMRAARDAWQQLSGQRDALAAHVERCRSLLDEALPNHGMEADHALLCELSDALEEQAPATNLIRLREERADEIRQSVSQARREWAAQGSPWVKAHWQAEALTWLLDEWVACRKGPAPWPEFIGERIDELRRQAKGGA